MRAGGAVAHSLNCSSKTRIMGVQYRVVVLTAALAPQYNVRGINVLSRVISPNATEKVIHLSQTNQTAYNATFATKDIEVSLDKGTMKATLNIGERELKCE
jgi:hypothetical protein